MSEFDNRKTYTIQCDDNIGEVKIADEVIAIIAGLAATEVEGVAAMAGDITKDLVSKLGGKKLAKGVTVAIEDDKVTVNLSIIPIYGYSIPEVSSNVQERVKSTIENMTGLTVEDINVRIADVSFDKKR